MQNPRAAISRVVSAVVGGLVVAGSLWTYFSFAIVRCRLGDGVACGLLADREREAPSGQVDLPRACDLYRRACTGNNYAGCANLGAWIARGKCAGTTGEALTVLERACDRGDVGGCNNLGMLSRDGAAGAPRDQARAAAAFRKACERTAIACDNLGAMLLDTDEAAASDAFRRGCELSEDSVHGAGCCYKLGLAHENGWGIPVDKERAAALYARTCKQVAGACYSLGLLELRGADPAGKARAAAHFREACSRGKAGACNNLGLMYAEGIGVALDYVVASELMAKACDGGEERACANLGSRYLTGEGVTKDPAAATALLDRACKGGVAQACAPRAP